MPVNPIAAGSPITAAFLNSLPVTLSELSTGSGGASSTSEVIIGTYPGVMAANGPTVGSGFLVRATGSCADGTTGQTVTFRLRLDSLAGTALFNTGITPGATGTRNWVLELFFYISAIGVSGSMSGGGYLNETISNASHSIIVTNAIDTTAAHQLVLTAQYSVSNASNLAATLGGAVQPC